MHHTGDGQWAGLLQALTDEELGQYGALAQDQIAREARWQWAQMVCCFMGAVAAAWGVVKAAQTGLDRGVLLWLAAAGVLFYWPYRGMKTRELWRGHVDAVEREQGRRSDGEASGA